MIHKIFCIHDIQAQAFLAPFFMHQVGMAERAFATCVNDPDHQFGKHPHDYTLFTLGEFDDATGVIEPYPTPRAVCNGVVHVKPKSQGDLFADEHKPEPKTNGKAGDARIQK